MDKEIQEAIEAYTAEVLDPIARDLRGLREELRKALRDVDERIASIQHLQTAAEGRTEHLRGEVVKNGARIGDLHDRVVELERKIESLGVVAQPSA